MATAIHVDESGQRLLESDQCKTRGVICSEELSSEASPKLLRGSGPPRSINPMQLQVEMLLLLSRSSLSSYITT